MNSIKTIVVIKKISKLFISFLICLQVQVIQVSHANTNIDNSKITKPTEQTPWDNEKKNLMSPLTTPAAWILGSGTLLSYIVYRDAQNRGEVGYDPNHKERTKGDWKYWGNILGWGAFQAIYTLTQLPGIQRGEKRALENTEMMWKSTLYTSLTTLALKLSIRAQRPNSEGKYESFPSGHASAAFAFATNVAIRHEWYWNFISVPMALWATSARIEDDSHHLHDSIFGAALGMSFAYGMNYISEDVPYMFGFEPMKDGGGLSFTYNY